MLPLSQSFTVIAVDPRGVGLSDKLTNGYDTGSLAKDMFALMSALGHQRFAMVCHDIGMWVGYATAADQPHRIARIALGEAVIPGVAPSPPLIPDDRTLNDFLWHNNFCRVRGINEELVAGREELFFNYQFTKINTPSPIPPEVRTFFVELLKRDRAALRASFEYYRAIDETIPQNHERMKKKLTMPILGFAGSLACAGEVESQLRMVASNVECTVLDDCGHFVPAERPEDLLKILNPFLAPYAIGS